MLIARAPNSLGLNTLLTLPKPTNVSPEMMRVAFSTALWKYRGPRSQREEGRRDGQVRARIHRLWREPSHYPVV